MGVQVRALRLELPAIHAPFNNNVMECREGGGGGGLFLFDLA